MKWVLWLTESSGPSIKCKNCIFNSPITPVALTIIFVLELMVFSSSSKSTVHSDAGEVLIAPSLGGCRGTYRMVPPGISILLIYLFEWVSNQSN